MGWMTLHSVSLCYPETPTESDKKIIVSFMDSFAKSITCAKCRDHFSHLFSVYKKNVPSWLNSRETLFLAVCRMHNNVNQRLDKPTPKTVQECLQSLKNATLYTPQFEFRKKYIEYLFRDWRSQRYSSYYSIAISAINEMNKLNEEYWNSRETPYDTVHFTEQNVLGFPNQPIQQKLVFQKISISGFIRKMKQ